MNPIHELDIYRPNFAKLYPAHIAQQKRTASAGHADEILVGHLLTERL
jgi:hypothetical protein